MPGSSQDVAVAGCSCKKYLPPLQLQLVEVADEVHVHLRLGHHLVDVLLLSLVLAEGLQNAVRRAHRAPYKDHRLLLLHDGDGLIPLLLEVEVPGLPLVIGVSDVERKARHEAHVWQQLDGLRDSRGAVDLGDDIIELRPALAGVGLASASKFFDQLHDLDVRVPDDHVSLLVDDAQQLLHLWGPY